MLVGEGQGLCAISKGKRSGHFKRVKETDTGTFEGKKESGGNDRNVVVIYKKI